MIINIKELEEKALLICRQVLCPITDGTDLLQDKHLLSSVFSLTSKYDLAVV